MRCTLTDIALFRAVEEVADAFARLDEAVATSVPGLATLLMLRSAQAIVAPQAGLPGIAVGGDASFATLLGWWYAAESREFVRDDPAIRSCALALSATTEKIRGGRRLSLALLRESGDAADSREEPGEDAAGLEVMDAVLRQAASESWPTLLLTATLLSGKCARVSGRAAAIGRAVAPLVGGLSADVFVVAPVAVDVASALHHLAVEARAARRRVDSYRKMGLEGREQAGAFGRGAASARAVLDLLMGTPAITVVGATAALGRTVPTVGAAVERLLDAGLLREITGRGRDRVFVYKPAIALAG